MASRHGQASPTSTGEASFQLYQAVVFIRARLDSSFEPAVWERLVKFRAREALREYFELKKPILFVQLQFVDKLWDTLCILFPSPMHTSSIRRMI
jgi:hypothetical protein